MINQYRLNSIMGRNQRPGIPTPGMGSVGPNMPTASPRTNVGAETGGGSAQGPNDRASHFYQELKRIREESSPGITAYKQALTEMPQEEDYKPNWLTRIASGLSGFGAGMKDPARGVETAVNINRSGYRNAMEAYSNKIAGLEQQAQMEQKDLDTKAEMVQNAMKYGLDYEKYVTERDAKESEKQAREKTAEASMIRAKATARPGYDHFDQADGSILYVNKNDPADRYTVDAKTVNAGLLSEQQKRTKIQQQQANTSAGQLGVAQGQLGVAQERQKTYDKNVDSLIENRGDSGFIAPSAQKSARDLALSELMTDRTWSEFLAPDVESDDFTQEEWKRFETAVQRKVQEIQTRRK
jgi:hypothetical protein